MHEIKKIHSQLVPFSPTERVRSSRRGMFALPSLGTFRLPTRLTEKVTFRGNSKNWSGNPNCCQIQVFWIAPWKYPPFFTEYREPNHWGQAPKAKGCDFFHLFLITTHCGKYYSEQVTDRRLSLTAQQMLDHYFSSGEW